MNERFLSRVNDECIFESNINEQLVIVYFLRQQYSIVMSASFLVMMICNKILVSIFSTIRKQFGDFDICLFFAIK